MREGLRSGNSASRSKEDEVSNSPALARKNVYNTRQKGSDLNEERNAGSEAEKGTNESSLTEVVELEGKSNGSSPKEAIEPEKDEALTCQWLTEKKVDSAVQRGSDLNEERNSEQIPCGSKSAKGTMVSSPKEGDEVEEDNNASSPNKGVGLEQREGPQNAECHRDCNVDSGEVAFEFAKNASKRTQLDGGKNLDESGVEKKNEKRKVGEVDGLDSKMQTAGRILRSASRARCDGESREFEDDVVGKTSSCDDDPEKERGESETEKCNQSDGEVSKILKPKSESGINPKMQGEAKMKESDQSEGEMSKKLGESCRKKRGRPRKVQVQVEMKEGDQSDGEMSKKLGESSGKKRGRPRKVQVQVEMKEGDQSDGEMRKKLGKSYGKKRGRPFKVQFEVEAEESDQYDGEMRKKLGESCGKKRGRPRKVQVEVEMKVSDESAEKEMARGDGESRELEDDVVGKPISPDDDPDKERAESEAEKSNQYDGELRKILKQNGESGRDPKIQGEVETKESDQSGGEMRKKLGESCGKKRGRPRKVQVEVEMKESDQSAEKERARGDGERKKLEDGALGETNSHGDDPEKERTESEIDKSNQSDGEDRKIWKQKGESKGDPKMQDVLEMKESDQCDGEMRKKLGESRGKKRGRPRKVQVEVETKESGQSANQLRNRGKKRPRKKRGRPSKMLVEVKIEESDQSDGYSRKKLKHKHGKRPGRPPIMQQTDGVLKVECDKENRIGTMRDSKSVLRSRDSLETDAFTSRSFSESIREELEMKMSVPAKGNKCDNSEPDDNESSFGSRSKAKTAVNLTKIRDNEGEPVRGKEGRVQGRAIKQAVRDRIVDLLLGAGWKIEYRRRNGREYSDAVYVNPKGKTHWSVTLAYRMLLESYENGNCESSSTGFKFIPIPDEELSVLKKVISKERCDKNVSRKGKKMIIRKTAEGVTSKKQRKLSKKKLKIKKTTEGVIRKKFGKRNLQKEKLMSSCGTPFKGRLKNKNLTHAQDNSAGSSHGGTPLLARMRKRRETHNQNRCALMVRNSKEGAEYESNGYVLYNGKRSVLAWMIDLGTVPINSKVQCFNFGKTRVMLEGKITKDGICCDCCGRIFTLSQFQTHAGGDGWQMFQNICLETGCSLLQCLLDSWDKQDESEHRGYHYIDVNGEDPNDDTCSICGDGGDLICCDGCPSTFHQSCLDINKFPSGDWCCIYCSCKFCGMASGNTCHRDEDNAACESTLLRTCCLCEEKYHHSCVRAKNAGNDDSACESFCGKKCQELNGKLQRLLGVKHDLDEGFSWTLIHRYDVDSDRSLDDVSQKIECNSKLAVALYIMDECFLPMVDYRSGVNLIRNIIYNYGSNFKRLNYVGFVTAILEKDDEIIAAASIRIHGNQLAEMPFIGTRYTYRRQGMCRRLLTGVESAMCALDVEKLVIPAISEMRETWTSVFGFRPVEASLKQKLRNTNMLVFPGVDMLQKPMSSVHETLLALEDLKSAELEEHQIMNESDNSDKIFSAPVDVSSEVTTPDTAKICDEPVVHESGSSLPPASLKDTSDVTNENNDLPASPCASDTKSLVQLSENPDYLGKKIDTIVNTLSRACDAFEQVGDIGKQHNAILVSGAPPCEGIEALDSLPKQLGVPEVEVKSSMVANIRTKADDSERQSLCASSDATESVACEVKIKDSIVKDSCNSHEDIKHDLDTKVSEKRTKHQASQEFQVAGSFDLDDKMLDTREMKKEVFQDISVATGVASSASVHNISSFKIDSTECPEAVVPPTNEGNCRIACGSVALEKHCLQTGMNGSQRSTDIPLDSTEVYVGGELDLEQEPDVALTDTLSLKHLESDLGVPQATIALCNPESFCGSSSTSGASMQCVSGGGNSCSAPPEVA